MRKVTALLPGTNITADETSAQKNAQNAAHPATYGEMERLCCGEKQRSAVVSVELQLASPAAILCFPSTA